MDKKQNQEIVIKILLLGDSGVGKTSILLRYVEEKYEQNCVSTIGIDYKIKDLEYKNFKIKLQIWDTSGEERYKSITQNFYRNTDCLFIVFDITKKKTFDSIKTWINEANEYNENTKIILLGNKIDLEDQRKVTKEIATNFANKNNLKYIETSAKENKGIEESFTSIIDLLLEGKNEKEILEEFSYNTDKSLSITTDKKNKKKKQCC